MPGIPQASKLGGFPLSSGLIVNEFVVSKVGVVASNVATES